MKDFRLSDMDKEQTFKLVRKQLRRAKTYSESPALEYLLQCRETLRLLIWAKEKEKDFIKQLQEEERK